MPKSKNKPPDLAIDGGAPVRTTPMPPRRAIGEGERKRIEECLAYYRDRQEDLGFRRCIDETAQGVVKGDRSLRPSGNLWERMP